MRTRRTVALGLSAVMAVSVLSGCGSSSSSTTADTKGESNASAESSTEPVVLHWWGSFAENMGPEQVCEAFNKIDPNLQVEYTRYVNDDAGNTKLDMTLMSDDSIDVFLNMNDVLLMKRIENGYMYPLDELFDCRFGRLPYRSLRFDFEYYDKPDYQGHSVVNYTVSEDFTRITEFKYLTGQQAEGTTIVKEYPFAYTGAAGEIPYYSIANEANQKLYEQYRGLVEHIPNVWLLGRLAEYKYYNIDAMVLKALELTDKIKKDKEV